MKEEPKGISFIDLGGRATCLQCRSRYCTCIQRQNGEWENTLPIKLYPLPAIQDPPTSGEEK